MCSRVGEAQRRQFHYPAISAPCATEKQITPLKADRLKHHETIHRLKFRRLLPTIPRRPEQHEKRPRPSFELQTRIAPLQAGSTNLGESFGSRRSKSSPTNTIFRRADIETLSRMTFFLGAKSYVRFSDSHAVGEDAQLHCFLSAVGLRNTAAGDIVARLDVGGQSGISPINRAA